MPSLNRGLYSPRWSLSGSFAVVLIAMSVFVLVVAGGVRLVAHLQYNQETITSRQRLAANVAEEAVRAFVRNKINTLRTAAWIADPYALTAKEQQELLQKIAGLQPSLKRVLIFNPEGVAVSVVSRLPRSTEQRRNIPHLHEALEAMRSADRYLGPVFIDTSTNEPGMVIAVPLRDAVGTVRGSLIGELNLKFLWDLIANMDLGDGGEAYVVDNSGALIAHRDPSRVLRGESARHLKPVAQFVADTVPGASQSMSYRGLGGDFVVGLYVPMQETHWAVVVEVPWTEAYSATIRETVINIVLLFLLVGLAAFLGGWLSRRLSEPIVRLRDTAGRIAQGEYGLQAEVSGPEEIAGLATAFNSMTRRLNRSLRDLETQVAEVSQAENALRAKTEELDVYFTNALDLLCIAGTDGKFRRVNKEWERSLGFPVGELEGRSFLEFVHPDDLQATLNAVSQLGNQQQVLNFVNRYRCKDGSYRWIEWRSYPVGALIYAAARDITERVRSEERITHLNEELERRVAERTVELETAVKELEAFSYSVSHDLHSPLRAVDGFTRVLMEEYAPALDAEARKLCEIIRQETQRMGVLIDDLLQFARLGRASMHPITIDMSVLAREAFISVTTPEERAHVDFSLQTLPPASGDLPMMRQVWVNLISNAVKFTSKAPHPRIEIHGASRDRECVYSVRDNGAGFDEKYAGRLFGVFQRLHSAREFGGTGAGLAIARRIIERHGGRIWAEGEPGKGATFHFSLPSGGV